MSAVGYQRAPAWSDGFLFTSSVRRQSGLQGALKRLLDIAVASLALIVLAIPMSLLAILIKLDSRGPAVLSQQRVGRDLEPFRMYKFRTMVVDAARLQDHLLDFNEASGPLFKIKRDPRMTRVGRLLRRASLDETPQLFNVLRGEMSLVGPRPIMPDELIRYGSEADYYLQVKPGITGLWQVSGRNNLDYSHRVFLDVWYVKNWSVLYDCAILLRTPGAVIRNIGAY